MLKVNAIESPIKPPDAARVAAIAAGRKIFYRPERVVTELIAAFVALPDAEYPGSEAVTRAAYQRPIALGATTGVFALRALHWPMLNLLDAAERQRRTFADAVAGAVSAARAHSA